MTLSYLDSFFGPAVPRYSGTDLPKRPTVEYFGAVVTDDPTNQRTIVTIAVPTLGAGMATWLATPSSANLLAAMTDETGSGKLTFATSPTFTTDISIAATLGGPRYIFTPNASMLASHVINLPNLTGGDNLVCEAFAQPLTNKTIVAASNTITDTSAATGDLFRFNGTRFVRFARGTANQVLTTNGAATDIVWGSPAGGLGTNVLSGANFISIGVNPAASGALRLPNATAISGRNVGNSADVPLLAIDASNYVILGNPSGGCYVQNQEGGNDFIVSTASGIALRIVSSQTQVTYPIVGASSPYGAHGYVVTAMVNADYTPTAAEYANYGLEVPITTTFTAARNMILPTPATEAGSYTKLIRNNQIGGFAVNVKTSAGSLVAIAANKCAVVLIRPAGASRVTADI